MFPDRDHGSGCYAKAVPRFLVLAALCLLLPLIGSSAEIKDVSLCAVMQAPEKYDGQELTMTVGYRVGFEWQELVCSPCNIRNKVWVEFDPDLKGAKKLKPTDRFDSLYRVRIRGVFVGKQGHYGHLNGYPYQFLIQEILSAKRVWQITPRQDRIPDATAAAACQP